jgi:protein TonB
VSVRRLAALAGSAALHAVAAGAVLALAAGLRQPQPLFIDLTGGAQGGEARAMSSAGAPGGDRLRPLAALPERAQGPQVRVTSPIARPREPAAAAEPELQPMAEPPRLLSQEASSIDSAALAMSAPVADGAVKAARPTEPSSPAGAVSPDGPVSSGGGMTSGYAVASRAPGGTGQPAGGATGSPLALAGPDRGDPPAEFGPYLARFRQLIQEYVVYPLAARRQGLSGRVELEVLLDATGRVRGVSLITSSAHALLDEAAIEAVRRVPSVPMPDHLPRRALRVRLPVVFELR